MFERMAMSLVISFVLKQLARFQGQIDWAKVREDMDARIRQLVPGTWFDEDAVHCANAVIDGIQHALGDGANIKTVLEMLAAQNWTGAASALRDMVLKAWSSGSVAATEDTQLLLSGMA